jgi:hypothetical protein
VPGGAQEGEEGDFASPTPTIPAPLSSVSLAAAATGSTLGGPSQLLLQRLTSTAQQMFPAGGAQRHAVSYLAPATGARPAASGGHNHERGRGVPASHPWSTAAAGLRTPASTSIRSAQPEQQLVLSQQRPQHSHPAPSRSLGHATHVAKDCPDTAGCSGTAVCTGAATAALAADPPTTGNNNESRTLDRLRGFTVLKMNAGAFSGLASGANGTADVMQTPVNKLRLHAPVCGKDRAGQDGGGSAFATQANTCAKAAPPSTGGATAFALTQATQHLSQILPPPHLLHSSHHHHRHGHHQSAGPSKGDYTPEHAGHLEKGPTTAGLHEGMGEAGSCPQQHRQQVEPQLQRQCSVMECVEIGLLPRRCCSATTAW